MTGAACRDCKFWLSDEVEELGECHRYAPRLNAYRSERQSADVGETMAVWPETYATDWCGEFMRKAPAAQLPPRIAPPG